MREKLPLVEDQLIRRVLKQRMAPGLGLDSIAPGLGTQTSPDALVKVIDSRRFAATVDVDARTVREIIQQVDAALADMKK